MPSGCGVEKNVRLFGWSRSAVGFLQLLTGEVGRFGGQPESIQNREHVIYGMLSSSIDFLRDPYGTGGLAAKRTCVSEPPIGE